MTVDVKRSVRLTAPFCRRAAMQEEQRQCAAWEREADALLSQMPPDAACPTYTETQLSRPAREHGHTPLDTLADLLPDAARGQSVVEELWFLVRMTPLTRLERACLRGWLLGLSQREIWEQARARLDISCQQEVSRRLRSALCKCYGEGGLTFAQFSARPLYRRPARRTGPIIPLRVCIYCREPFFGGRGRSLYCSPGCREAAGHRE